MTPSGNVTFILDSMLNKHGEEIDDAKGSGHQVRIPVPEDIDLEYALLMRNLDYGTDTRNPFKQDEQVVQA